MSLILDALKKLDREKSSRPPVSANIAAGILRPAAPRPGKKNVFYVAAACVSALAAAGVTYGILEYGSPRKTETAATAPLVAAQSAPPSQLPAAAAPQVTPPAQRQAASAVPAREPAREVRPAAARTADKVRSPGGRKAQPVPPAPAPKPAGPPEPRPAAEAAPPQAANPAPAKAAEQIPAARDSREAASATPLKTRSAPETKAASPVPEKPQARKTVPEASPVPEKPPARKTAPEPLPAPPTPPARPADASPAASAAATPSLKLSGIVWHEEPAARRAVVNGTFAAEGSVVEGVKVVEIHPNRVAFSHNGQSFEIVMFR